MEYVESAKECIERRLEGREALSWIERLGVYVIDENIYHAEPERCENVLAIRFNRHAFNAYYCYFYTNEKRETKFTVNRLVEGMDIKEIEDMLSEAQWNSDSTQGWWCEVFANGKMDQVDDVLINQDHIKVAEKHPVGMLLYVKQLKEHLEMALDTLWNGKGYSVEEVFVSGDYAQALPLQYALHKIYGCGVENIDSYQGMDFFCEGLTFKKATEKFYLPWGFRNTHLNISPTMTLEEVASTNGISLPLPVTVTDSKSKKIASIELDDKPIEGYDALSWDDLIVNDNYADLQLDDYYFKDILLTVVPDGFGAYYIGNASDKKYRIDKNML